MGKRKCTGTVKSGPRKGQRCGAWAMKGHLVCLGHADQKTRETMRFGGAQPGAGRPKKLKPMDIEREVMERYVLAWMRPYWRALGFDVGIADDGSLYLTELPEGGAKIYGESKEGDINMTEYDDLGAQITAAEKLRDRVFGRPKQTTEISGPGGGKIEVDVTQEAVQDARDAFLASFPQGTAPIPAEALLPPGSNN